MNFITCARGRFSPMTRGDKIDQARNLAIKIGNDFCLDSSFEVPMTRNFKKKKKKKMKNGVYFIVRALLVALELELFKILIYAN